MPTPVLSLRAPSPLADAGPQPANPSWPRLIASTSADNPADDPVEELVEVPWRPPGGGVAQWSTTVHPWATSPSLAPRRQGSWNPPTLVGPPALFPAPWALLPAMTLTDAERQEAVCAIFLDPLATLPQPIGLRVGRALHVFGYQSLKRWLRQSSGYGDDGTTFKNPANGVWTPRSAIRRIVVPAADADGGSSGPMPLADVRERVASNDQALDLAGALVDLGDAGIS